MSVDVLSPFAATMRAELKEFVEVEMKKLNEEFGLRVFEINNEIDRRASEMEKAWKKTIGNGTDGNESIAAEEETAKTKMGDGHDTTGKTDTRDDQAGESEESKRKFTEAFLRSGGDDALEENLHLSKKLHEKVVEHRVVEKEVESLLPPSLTMTGNSKLLVNQPYVETLDELYEMADKARVRFESSVREIANRSSSYPNIPPLKGRARAEEKAKFKYSDHDGKGVAYYRLTDIVRATLQFKNIADMYKGLKLVDDCIHFDIIEFNDRFQNQLPNADGYRDIQMTVKLRESGFVCELQMSTNLMSEAKATFGHRGYEVYRQLDAAIKARDHSRVETTLDFCREQLGRNYTNKNFLPTRCHSLLHKAAEAGDARTLDLLIRSGADVNIQDEEGNTSLHYAVFNGFERCVWLLLDKHKCETTLRNKADETALMKGYLKFYSRPSEPSRRAIATLLQKVNLEQVNETVNDFQKFIKDKLQKRAELVDASYDGDQKRMMDLLCDYTHPDSERDGRFALVEAVTQGHSSSVQLLMEFKANLPSDIVSKAIECKHYAIAKMLLDKGAEGAELTKFHIPCDKSKRKWTGIARYGNKLFCSPYNASSVLVIDSETEEIRTIPCPVEGNDKWYSIARCGNKLFCCPYNASSILVIDGDTEEIHTIQCEVPGDGKWSGIARCGNKLFCTPYNASSILVIDGEKEKIHTIECGISGDGKWFGSVMYDNKLFCAPSNAENILVIDGKTEDFHTIQCGVEGKYKWYGIGRYRNKLFCTPYYANSILVIDGDTEKTHTVNCESGTAKWYDMTLCGNKLFCAPCNADSILVIDGETERIENIPCGGGSYKYYGIAQSNNKIFCSPGNATSILGLEDMLTRLERKNVSV